MSEIIEISIEGEDKIGKNT